MDTAFYVVLSPASLASPTGSSLGRMGLMHGICRLSDVRSVRYLLNFDRTVRMLHDTSRRLADACMHAVE